MSAVRFSHFVQRASSAARIAVAPRRQQLTYRHLSRGFGLFHGTPPQLGVITFKLADIGEGITEVELLKWLAKEGEMVEEMGNLCEVQSDKSAVEISSPFGGKIIKFHHAVGEMIKIGEPLMDIDVPDGDEPTATAATPDSKEPGTSNSRADEPNAAGAAVAPPPQAELGSRAAVVLASPACKRLAAEMKIDLAQVKGTGLGGRITKEDILNFKNSNAKQPVESPEAATAPSTKPHTKSKPGAETKTKQVGEQKEEVMLTSGVAKGMIKSMKASLEVPHMSIQEDVDVSNLFAMRTTVNKHLAAQNPPQKLTVTPFIVKAVSQALKRVPIMNSKFNTATEDRYTLYHNHNVSIAIDTPNGLLVPNIKNVESLTLSEIQEQLSILQGLAAAGKLTPAHLTGGTISISNVGTVGGTAVRPILFDGQATILGLGRVQKLPRYNEATKAFDARDILNVTASVDHRHVDGATVARFMS